MTHKLISLIILIMAVSSAVYSQHSFLSGLKQQKYRFENPGMKLLKDTTENPFEKSQVQKANVGGLFVTPTVGISFPEGTFSNYSNSGFLYGVKIEIAYSRLYPFVFGFVYEHQNNAGDPNFMNTNSLAEFDTDISYVGGSVDFILNKYIKSNFTIPVLTAEIKYASVTRTVNPPFELSPDLGVTLEENLLTYTAGLGFTIYIFDITGKYTVAGDFSNLTIQTRLHFPLITF